MDRQRFNSDDFPRIFRPVNDSWQILMATALGIPVIHTHSIAEKPYLRPPTHSIDVVGDGACFFRCIALAITGTQDYHFIIRRAVLAHMRANPHIVEGSGVLDGENVYVVEDHIRRTNMESLTSWATQAEIFVTAHMLKTAIYVYHEPLRGWQYHHPGNDNVNANRVAIYLRNPNFTHFQFVNSIDNAEEQRPEGIFILMFMCTVSVCSTV